MIDYNLAQLLSDIGEKEDAHKILNEATGIQQELVKLRPDDAKTASHLAAIYNTVASTYREQRLFDEALQFYTKASETTKRFFQNHSNDADCRYEYSKSLSGTGSVHRVLGHVEQSLQAHEAALSIREQLVDEYPRRAEYRTILANTHRNLGNLKSEMGGKTEEALRHCEVAHTMWETLAREYSSRIKFRRDLAGVECDIGKILRTMGRIPEAAERIKHAAEMQRALLVESPDQGYLAELAGTYSLLGDVLRRVRQFPEAIQTFHQSIEIRSGLLENDKNNLDFCSDLGATLNDLGMALSDSGNLEEAVSMFEEAVVHQRRAFDESPNIAKYRRYLNNHFGNLTLAFLKMKRANDAAAAAHERRKLWPGSPRELYGVAQHLAQCASIVEGDEELNTLGAQPNREKYAEQTIAVLQEAVAAGFKDFRLLETDPKLNSIRFHPRFQELTGNFQK